MAHNRSGGVGLYSASNVMRNHPQWTEFVRGIAGWTQVEPGTLTLDECVPLPLVALRGVSELAEEPPAETFFAEDARYLQIMRQRGTRRFYRAVARSGSASYAILISQQDLPAVPHRLELYADNKLRRVLALDTAIG